MESPGRRPPDTGLDHPGSIGGGTNRSPGPDKTTCQTIFYADNRKLVTIDLDTASETKVRVLANQILAASVADELTMLPGRLQERLDGTSTISARS